jgi:hypothetical protein
MAFDLLQPPPSDIVFPYLGGIDESVQNTDLQDRPLNVVDNIKPLVNARGVFPFWQGMHRRMTGKKTIDFNPGQKVYAIHQTFNGVCQYGYYVQTSAKLYYHLCSAPPDMRIHFYF